MTEGYRRSLEEEKGKLTVVIQIYLQKPKYSQTYTFQDTASQDGNKF